MSEIMTNFRASDMLGAKKAEVKKVAPKVAPKIVVPTPEPVVAEAEVVVEAEVVAEVPSTEE